MKWNKYRLRIKTEAEDIVTAALADIGIAGVEIEDKTPLSEADRQQMFVDIPPEAESDDGVAHLIFYLDPESEDIPAMLARVREELDDLRAFCDIGDGTIEDSVTDNVDWENEWKKYFQPFRIDDIYVVPSWVRTLRIDPGTAFGTGMHETTQLCIRQMRKHMKPGATVLDVGTGSGILGILALMYGAGSVLGTDLDPNAETAVEENCGNNDVPYRGGDMTAGSGFSFLLGNLIDDPAVGKKVGESKYDIVFSNILADVLTLLAPAVARALAPGGCWITSGILEGKETTVIEAAERAGLQAEEVNQQGEWRSVTFRKQTGTERRNPV